jgi:hypothetical protein
MLEFGRGLRPTAQAATSFILARIRCFAGGTELP